MKASRPPNSFKRAVPCAIKVLRGLARAAARTNLSASCGNTIQPASSMPGRWPASWRQPDRDEVGRQRPHLARRRIGTLRSIVHHPRLATADRRWMRTAIYRRPCWTAAASQPRRSHGPRRPRDRRRDALRMQSVRMEPVRKLAARRNVRRPRSGDPLKSRSGLPRPPVPARKRLPLRPPRRVAPSLSRQPANRRRHRLPRQRHRPLRTSRLGRPFRFDLKRIVFETQRLPGSFPGRRFALDQALSADSSEASSSSSMSGSASGSKKAPAAAAATSRA